LSVPLRMEGQNVDKVHIRHLMLEFRKGDNVTGAITSVYSSALSVSALI